jgi:hypothetical protein
MSSLTCEEMWRITNVMIMRGLCDCHHIYDRPGKQLMRTGCADEDCYFCNDVSQKCFEIDPLFDPYQSAYFKRMDRATLLNKIANGAYNLATFCANRFGIDAESAPILFDAGYCDIHTLQFVSSATIIQALIHRSSPLIYEFSDAASLIFTRSALNLLLAELRRKDISRDVKAKRFCKWAILFANFSEADQDYAIHEIGKLFPIILLNGYYRLRDHFKYVGYTTNDICTIETIDCILNYSAVFEYRQQVCNLLYHYLYKHQKLSNTGIKIDVNNYKWITDLSHHLSQKYPKYLAQVMTMPVYHGVFSNIAPIMRRGFEIGRLISLRMDTYIGSLHLLPKADRAKLDIGAINKYVNFLYTRYRLHDKYDGKLMKAPFDIKKVVEINYGIANCRFDSETMRRCIDSLFDNKCIDFNPQQIHNAERQLVAHNALMDILREDPYVLPIINREYHKIVLQQLHAEFCSDLKKIQNARHFGLPPELIEFVELYYIKPSATEDDFAAMNIAIGSPPQA